MADLEELGLEEFRSMIEGSEDEPIVTTEAITAQSSDSARQDVRVPWVFSSRLWQRQSPRRKITMWVNPGTINIEMPKRATLEKTAAGTVMHQLKIRGRESVFDEFNFTFEANTGNILPIRYRDAAREMWSIAPGLVNKYDMNELQGQTHIIEETGEPNFIYAYLSTPAYPLMTLTGWFDPQAYAFGEDAENPNSIKYSLKLEVLATDPKLSSAADAIRAFTEANNLVPGVPTDAR